MIFKIGVYPRKHDSLNSTLVDIISSASYFGRKDLKVREEDGGFSFMLDGDTPHEYLSYLESKYELALGYEF